MARLRALTLHPYLVLTLVYLALLVGCAAVAVSMRGGQPWLAP